jgi:hypothetical protein
LNGVERIERIRTDAHEHDYDYEYEYGLQPSGLRIEACAPYESWMCVARPNGVSP